MKIALFTFIALVVGTLAQNNNNNCLLGSGAPGTSCSTNNQCVTGLSCVNGLCNFVNLGQVCSSDAQCGGLYPFCIGGRCDAKRIPGDPCSVNEQCISNTCSSGACLARQLNEACGGSDCAPGLYCSATTRVCTSKIAVGSSCSNEYVAMVSNIAFAHDLSVMCTDSALCDYNPNSSVNTGVCTPIFSANEGSCGAFGAFTCPVGSTCNGNSCVGISGNNGNECGVNAQCSGITTFCACTGNNNNNFQVFNSSNTGVVTAIRQLGGASVGTQGASANVAGAGTSVGTQGASANVAGVGASVGTQGAAVGTQGTAVGVGQNGAAVGTQGAAVGVGQNGVAAGTQGTGVVVGSNGAVVGTQGTTVVINTANFQGRCRNDQCLNSYSPDYYSCLLQNGCGLSTSPVLISGTCANKCAFLYSRIQCCQAGYQPIISNNTNSENNNRGSNSLQRSIALPPQIQCVQFSQQPEPSAAGVLEAGIAVLASLIGVMLF